jgi:putative flippase GtrA
MRRQAILFSVAGIVGFVVDASVLYIALWAGLGYFAGRIASFLVAVFATWQVNRRFTFADVRQRSAWSEWWHYLAAMSIGGVLNYLAYSAFVVFMPPGDAKPLLAVAVGSAAGMLVNFVGAKFWVFRPR